MVESSPEALASIALVEPIGLAEMESIASLTERRDRKYLVDEGDLEEILGTVGDGFRALEIDGLRSFGYETVYFDTPEMTSYMMAARRRPHRFKVRTRSYLDSRLTALEVKERRGDGSTSKLRMPYRFEDRESLTAEARACLAASVDGQVDDLARTLTVNYTRVTLVGTRTRSRITIDTDLTAARPDGRRVNAEGIIVVETKTVGHATGFDRLLWRRHRRPTSISKYCTLLAAIDPTLPANNWNRTLRRHFDWEPSRV